MTSTFRPLLKAIARNTLSLRLLSYILAVSTLLALLITLLQLFWDYRQDVGQVQNSLDQIDSSFVQPIAASLWNLDEEQILVQLEGIMNLPSMQFVEVKEMMGDSQVRLLSLGAEQSQYDLTREYTLTYQGEEVGRLFVASSLSQIYQRLIEKSLVIMVSQTIKTLVVSVITSYSIHYTKLDDGRNFVIRGAAVIGRPRDGLHEILGGGIFTRGVGECPG